MATPALSFEAPDQVEFNTTAVIRSTGVRMY